MTGRALPTLRTPRLTLRPLEPTDAKPIRDAIANWDVVRWLSVVTIVLTACWISVARYAGNQFRELTEGD